MPAVPRPLAFLIVIAALKVLLIGYWIVGGADLIGQQSSLEAPTLATAEADPAAEEPLAAAGANAPPAADELQTLSEPNLDEPPSTPRDDDLLTLDETLPIEPAGWRALLAPGAAAAGGTGLQPLVDDSPPVQEIAESIEPVERPLGWPAAVPWTVRPGEIISGIAERFGVPNHVLLRFNGIGAAEVISVGIVIWIPSRLRLQRLELPVSAGLGAPGLGAAGSGARPPAPID